MANRIDFDSWLDAYETAVFKLTGGMDPEGFPDWNAKRAWERKTAPEQAARQMLNGFAKEHGAKVRY